MVSIGRARQPAGTGCPGLQLDSVINLISTNTDPSHVVQNFISRLQCPASGPEMAGKTLVSTFAFTSCFWIFCLCSNWTVRFGTISLVSFIVSDGLAPETESPTKDCDPAV